MSATDRNHQLLISKVTLPNRLAATDPPLPLSFLGYLYAVDYNINMSSLAG